MSKNRRKSDSHPVNFSRQDMVAAAIDRDRWLDHNRPLDCISVDLVRQSVNEATYGAYGRIQWLWEQLEPADSILATCVERRLGALVRIPWDIVKKPGLNDAEDVIAEAQLRTLRDFANALENLDEGIMALAQASFRHYRKIQLLETEEGNLRLNVTDNWNWCRDGYNGEWLWNPAATFGLSRGERLPVDPSSIITRICPRPIDQPAMMLCLDRKNSKAQWLVFNSRYGTPPLFAVMPQGLSEDVKRAYIEFAAQCVSNAAGVLPAGSDIKAITPGTTGPQTFKELIDLSTQELVLRATGGLMTMLTAPGAGTNTATGSAHADAFDDLAEREAEEIAACLNSGLFAPLLDQWHPGQPHLVEFAMRRPDSDNAAGSVNAIAQLAACGYRVPDEQVRELTGLQVSSANMDSTAIYAAKAAGYVPTMEAMGQRMGMPLQPAPVEGAPAEGQPTPGAAYAANMQSIGRRWRPLMKYPAARAAFDAAIERKVALNAAAEAEAAERKKPLSDREIAAVERVAKLRVSDLLPKDAATLERGMLAGVAAARKERRAQA